MTDTCTASRLTDRQTVSMYYYRWPAPVITPITPIISTCVCPLVGGEVVRPGEHLAAHPAAVGLVAGVEPHVAAQHVAPGKRSLANLAQIRFRVRVCTVSGAGLKCT